MDLGRGKSITTSVPSMTIRFNATAEEIEEIYTSEEEPRDHVGSETASAPAASASIEIESSPRRLILPLLSKRSTSIDTSSSTSLDASPPSDPWRFLSDIKGKITKSVEGKLTEYKSRTLDGDGSPKLPKPVKDSKGSSSLSDSEEMSESSISKTCGGISTTEGAEMSSDDETPSLSEKDKPHNETVQLANPSSSPSLRQRFRITNKKSTVKEGSVGMEFLENIQKINEGVIGHDSEIESGVDVLADLNVSNFHVDSDNVLNVTQVTGSEMRADVLNGAGDKTVFSPIGFVDLRPPERILTWFDMVYRYALCGLMILTFYYTLPLTLFMNGFLIGVFFTVVVCYTYFKLFGGFETIATRIPSFQSLSILEIPAAKEYHPLWKYEGWVNEYPEEYNPHNYHVSQTQSVYLKLQGNFLKVSHGRQKIPKRAMWNEPEHKLVFTSHRIYNLLGAKVALLPKGLAKVRHWSKKYPICITLSKEQMNFEFPTRTIKEHKHFEKTTFGSEAQVFSKLTEEAEEPSTTKMDMNESDTLFISGVVNECLSDCDAQVEAKHEDGYEEDEDDDDDAEYCDITWDDNMQHHAPNETNVYLFGRTGREKEDWFRRLRAATHQIPEPSETDLSEDGHCSSEHMNHMLSHVLEEDYIKHMSKMASFISFCDDHNSRILSIHELEENKEPVEEGKQTQQEAGDSVWVNILIARVLFDCLRELWVVQRIKDRIQRKLTSIKLPYFIQALYCEELNLGSATPYIHKTYKPVINCRGLWIDLDVTYEGLISVILQTKLDLLKLRAPPGFTEKVQKEKSAIFHSDVDDSAESTTDEEYGNKVAVHTSSVLDSTGQPVPGLGGTSNKSKKLMKMVDRIAESKFFQAAAENKYIKKAMEGVSNTDLRLKVELKKCMGTLVLNIPPPPSDRIWLGFRVSPELIISAHPIVGERNINFLRVTSWIEKKIHKEFQKLFVLPNMEDLSIPVMSSRLPD